MCIDSCFINLFVYLQYLDRLVQFSFKAGLNPLVLWFLVLFAWVLLYPMLTRTEKMQEMGPMVYGPYPWTVECLTIGGSCSKGSTFFSVTLICWVLVLRSTTWVNHAWWSEFFLVYITVAILWGDWVDLLHSYVHTRVYSTLSFLY